jgi:predicted acetyltransferase
MWRSAPELVHPVDVAEVPGYAGSISRTFLDPAGLTEERLGNITRSWDPQRAWGVRDDGRWVATLRTLDRTLTVPGLDGAIRTLAADAVTAVTVASTHRRRGLMSAMLGDSLRAARERGDPLSILVAAEWPIYGRFGYAPAAFGVDWAFHIRRAGATLDGDVTRVREVDREAFTELAPELYRAFCGGRAGQVDRDGIWWDRRLAAHGWPEAEDLTRVWLVHEGDDGPDGLLTWKAREQFGFFPPLSVIDVPLLAPLTDEAYRDLWAYLSAVDGVEEVRLSARPVDEPVRWLLRDGRTLIATEQRDHLWLRLLDVPAALSGRRYATPGEIVLEVTDASVVSVAGRYRLSADGDAVTCEPTTSAPELTLTQTALAAIYLGGAGLFEQVPAGGVTEHSPGAILRVQTMFSTPLAPWNATGF